MPGHPVLDPDLAPVARNKNPAYGEPEAPAPFSAVFSLEAGEYRYFCVITDSWARVRDGDDDCVVHPFFDGHCDLDPRPAMPYGVADQVCEDLGEEVVGEDLQGLPIVVDMEVGEVGDLAEDHGVEIDGSRPGPVLVDLPDGGDICCDLDDLPDPILQLPGVMGCVPLEFIDEDIGVDAYNVAGVLDVVGEDIQVEVCLTVRCFKSPVEHPPQDAGTDLPAYAFEERAFPGGEGSRISAPDDERSKGVRFSDERYAGEGLKPGVAALTSFDVPGVVEPECVKVTLDPPEAGIRDVLQAVRGYPPLPGTATVYGAAIVTEEVERLIERGVQQFSCGVGSNRCADDSVEQEEMAVSCLEFFFSALPVGDIPYDDLDRGLASKERPRTSSLTGNRRSIKPYER